MATQMVGENVPAQAITIIFILGAPGAGKGTLSKRFGQAQQYYHLSVGDYLRALRNSFPAPSPDELGGLTQEELRTNLKARNLIPASQIVAIIGEKMQQEQGRGFFKFVIDGFPRSDDSAKAFEQLVRSRRQPVFGRKWS